MVNLLSPVVSILVWFKILVEVSAWLVGHMVTIGVVTWLLVSIFVVTIVLSIVWISVVNWLLLLSQESMHQLVVTLSVVSVNLMLISLKGVVQVVVILVVLWNGIVSILMSLSIVMHWRLMVYQWSGVWLSSIISISVVALSIMVGWSLSMHDWGSVLWVRNWVSMLFKINISVTPISMVISMDRSIMMSLMWQELFMAWLMVN